MIKEILIAIGALLIGLGFGLQIGENIGWWRCFKSFEKYSKNNHNN